MTCKNCNHPIKRRYFTYQGQSMWEWTHKQGGTYCKIGGFSSYSSCLCNQAEPKED